MSRPELKSDDDDTHLRFHVVETGFSEDDDKVHEQAMAWIAQQLENGRTWVRITKELPVADEDLRKIILDDFPKITMAQRHFQGQESLQAVARYLHMPEKQLRRIKQDMIREVEEASVKAYHLKQEMEAAAKKPSH